MGITVISLQAGNRERALPERQPAGFVYSRFSWPTEDPQILLR